MSSDHPPRLSPDLGQRTAPQLHTLTGMGLEPDLAFLLLALTLSKFLKALPAISMARGYNSPLKVMQCPCELIR